MANMLCCYPCCGTLVTLVRTLASRYGRSCVCTAAKDYREWAQEAFCYDSIVGIGQNEAYAHQRAHESKM